MGLPERESRPAGGNPSEPASVSTAIKNNVSLLAPADYLADLDALAESLRGHFVVQVVVDDAGHRRTSVYRSAGAAERAVTRARERGRTAHVSLVQMLPVGVIVGLGGAFR